MSRPGTRPQRARPSTARAATAFGADLFAVAVFVVLGRRAHDEGDGAGFLLGTAQTAWPFLTGTALGWAALELAGRGGRGPDPTSVRGGLAVLAAAVTVGMTLRRLAGGGVQASFVAVATTVLALLLLGWRAVAARRGRA